MERANRKQKPATMCGLLYKYGAASGVLFLNLQIQVNILSFNINAKNFHRILMTKLPRLWPLSAIA